ncbi:MAG: hypothetical protein RIQ37_263 [Actinomycetota bacterium]
MGRHSQKRGRRSRGLTSVAIFSVGSLVMLTAVDPYSGTMASAQTMNVYERVEDAQTVEVYLVEDSDFERAELEIISGEQVTRLFINAAPYPDPNSTKGFALSEVERRGWDYSQYSCLVKLWERESNWRWNALNRSSGAYGIPQSLPGNKMASAGADWRTNPETQVKWGLGYIDGRYGSPCSALAHSDRRGWY